MFDHHDKILIKVTFHVVIYFVDVRLSTFSTSIYVGLVIYEIWWGQVLLYDLIK